MQPSPPQATSDARDTQSNGPDSTVVRAAAPPRVRIPSIGRIVLFNGHGHPEPEKSPAVIRRANDNGTLDLTFFGPKGCVPMNGVVQGDLVGQWNWPLLVPEEPFLPVPLTPLAE